MPEAARCPDCGTELVAEPGIPGLCPQCLLSLALLQSDDVDQEAPTLDQATARRVLGERYQLRELLGRGGMGEVYRAFDLKLRVDVALKAVRPDRVEGARAREMLRREVRSAREVVSPNVCRIFDLVDAGDEELVSMEYVDGQTLGEVLRERGPLELREAREIASQLLSGLEAIHRAGLVHRDVKPENVMLTRAGRVVVMDLGLAKVPTQGPTATIAGTPAYMAPEQARGDAVDARADVFAAGVLLAEMLSVGGKAPQARQELWRGIRETPPRVPEGPWAAVLRQCVAVEPASRPASAQALARSLEEVTQRLPEFEQERPYPGLSSFTEAEAEYFHGRELETEAVVKKLKRPRMLALVGPSGAGKSSFLRAGLLPTLPASWTAVIATPGTRPFQSLAQVLLPHFAQDMSAMQEFLRFEEPDTAVGLVSRWRRRHEHALVVVDQFEELFTQNPKEVQASFATLLGRLVLEADAHVVLSLRDDFLGHCHGHEALAPILNELTLLGPLGESGLRRALVQPALSCGYHFEDEALVDEMVQAVRGERGALPLLAFAASRLWDLRDRERGLLTRAAYREIGGVAGALAQHAEATLELVGTARTPLVRELFRNLVTAQGTRAVREREELLSVFAETAGTTLSAVSSSETPGERVIQRKREWSRAEAEEALRALVDARLLTQYEREDEPGASRAQVEIVHESLLSAWPRLVRWQTQDADGAQLRDQLRQAAQAWHDRGRPDDLLWTGSAYRDFAVWRERYGGGLSATELAFAHAAAQVHGRRRRRRRLAAVSGIVISAAVAITTSVLWQRADASRRAAEAAELVALGRLRIDRFPTAALAYSIASLEHADNAPARRFALEALWRGPMASVLTDPVGLSTPLWSPDGRQLAVEGFDGVVVFDEKGGRHELSRTSQMPLGFSDDGSRLVTVNANWTTFRVWSLPSGRLVRSWDSPAPEAVPTWVRRAHVMQFVPDSGAATPSRPYLIREEPIDGGEPLVLRRWQPGERTGLFGPDPRFEWLFSMEQGQLLQRRLDALEASPRVLGRHEGRVFLLASKEGRVVTSDYNGEIRVWEVASGTLQRILKGPAGGFYVRQDAAGRYIAVAPPTVLPAGGLNVFDLQAPQDADPQPLDSEEGHVSLFTFHPSGHWLASGHDARVQLWNLAGKRSIVLRGQKPSQIALAFTPDNRLVSTSDEGVVRLWPLFTDPDVAPRVLWPTSESAAHPPTGGSIDVDRAGRAAAVVERDPGGTSRIIVLPLAGSPPRPYPMPSEGKIEKSSGFDPTGRHLAVLYDLPEHPEATAIRVLDLATGSARELRGDPDPGDCEKAARSLGVGDNPFWLPDGRFLSRGPAGLREWDLATGSSRQLRPCRVDDVTGQGPWFAATPDSKVLLGLSFYPDAGRSLLWAFDLAMRTERRITTHGERVTSIALDPAGKTLVTGDADGLVEVGPLSGEGVPHLLYGHSRRVTSVAVSPDGKWIASGSDDGTIRLWPMPDGPPLHTLPYDELLAKLRSLTNLRAVPDPGAATGYKVQPGPFPGWAKTPVW